MLTFMILTDETYYLIFAFIVAAAFWLLYLKKNKDDHRDSDKS